MKRKRPAVSILQRSTQHKNVHTQGKHKASQHTSKRQKQHATPTPPVVEKQWHCASIVDQQASKAVARMLHAEKEHRHGVSLKNLTLAPGNQAKAATHAVACETLKRMVGWWWQKAATIINIPPPPIQTCQCCKPSWIVCRWKRMHQGYAVICYGVCVPCHTPHVSRHSCPMQQHVC